MQFASNLPALVLLRIQEHEVQPLQFFLRLLPAGYIDAGANKAFEGAVRTIFGKALIKYPMILSVRAAHAVLHLEVSPLRIGTGKNGQAMFFVVRINSFGPSVTEFFIQSAPSKSQPAPVN